MDIENELFGFRDSHRRHHFTVHITRSDDCDMVEVTEETDDGAELKAIIGYGKWMQIAQPLRHEFNRRNKTKGAWKRGANMIPLSLGKELMVLLYAIEDEPPHVVEKALINWSGLAPEERWWLYTQANASSARDAKNNAWRKAIKVALTE